MELVGSANQDGVRAAAPNDPFVDSTPGIAMRERTGIRIAPADNVVTVVEEADPGDRIRYAAEGGERHVTAVDRIPPGHKVAVDTISPGAKILKYNQTIGTASAEIREGQHVHVHNVRSAVEGVEDEC
jgi:hypothetical protein